MTMTETLQKLIESVDEMCKGIEISKDPVKPNGDVSFFVKADKIVKVQMYANMLRSNLDIF